MILPKIVLILIYAHSPHAQSFGIHIDDQQIWSYSLLTASNRRGLVVRVKDDGNVEFGPGFAGDSAAREFWSLWAQQYGFSCQYERRQVSEEMLEWLLYHDSDGVKATIPSWP